MQSLTGAASPYLGKREVAGGPHSITKGKWGPRSYHAGHSTVRDCSRLESSPSASTKNQLDLMRCLYIFKKDDNP